MHLIKCLKILRLGGSSVKISEISCLLDINWKGFYNFLNKCFKKLVDSYCIYKEFSIRWKDIVVEIYESKFGKNKYNRGHKLKGFWVF